MWVCRWARQPDGSRLLIPPASCAMSFTGTRRQPAAQVRHTVAVHRYNIWNKNPQQFVVALSSPYRGLVFRKIGCNGEQTECFWPRVNGARTIFPKSSVSI